MNMCELQLLVKDFFLLESHQYFENKYYFFIRKEKETYMDFFLSRYKKQIFILVTLKYIFILIYYEIYK